MTLVEKYQPKFCFAMDTSTYERMASAVKPEHRFVDVELDERHVIVVDDTWKPVIVFYVPEEPKSLEVSDGN